MAEREKNVVKALELIAESRKFRRGLGEAGRDLARFERSVQRHMANIRREERKTLAMRERARARFGASLHRGFDRGLNVAGVGGIALVATQLRGIREYESVLEDMTITGNKSLRWLQQQRKALLDFSIQTGISKTQVIGFAGTIIEQTGSVKLYQQTLKAAGLASHATGADLRDLANVVVQLNTNLRVPPKNMARMLTILHSQAKKGQISLKAMAKDFVGLAAVAGKANFGEAFQGEEGVRSLGTLFQLARRGGKSPEQAATDASAFLTTVFKKRAALQAAGFNVLDKRGKFRAGGDVLRNIGTRIASGKLSSKLIGKLFPKRALLVASRLGGIAKEGFDKDIGASAAFEKIFSAGGKGTKELEDDAKKRSKMWTEQWKRATARFQAEMHKSLLPALAGFTKVLPTLSKWLGWAARNLETIVKIWAMMKALSMAAHLRRLAFEMQGVTAGAGAARGQLSGAARGLNILAGTLLGLTLAASAPDLGKQLGDWMDEGLQKLAGKDYGTKIFEAFGGKAPSKNEKRREQLGKFRQDPSRFLLDMDPGKRKRFLRQQKSFLETLAPVQRERLQKIASSKDQTRTSILGLHNFEPPDKFMVPVTNAILSVDWAGLKQTIDTINRQGVRAIVKDKPTRDRARGKTGKVGK